MKLSHLGLVIFWILITTAEAQVFKDPFQAPFQNRNYVPYGGSEPAYLTPIPAPQSRYRRPREVILYQHPDDGLPSQAPYIRVPTNDYYNDPYSDPYGDY